MGRRVRILIGAWVLVEVLVYVLVATQIGVGWTILLTLATTAVGMSLVARQGTRALSELRERARTHRSSGRALGDAGLGAVGALLIVLPGFVGDVVGLCCLVPGLRAVPRALVARAVSGRLPARFRGPVHVRSERTGSVGTPRTPGPARVIEGEVAEE